MKWCQSTKLQIKCIYSQISTMEVNLSFILSWSSQAHCGFTKQCKTEQNCDKGEGFYVYGNGKKIKGFGHHRWSQRYRQKNLFYCLGQSFQSPWASRQEPLGTIHKGRPHRRGGGGYLKSRKMRTWGRGGSCQFGHPFLRCLFGNFRS